MSVTLKTIEPTIFELSRPGRVGTQMPTCDVPEQSVSDLLPGIHAKFESIRKDHGDDAVAALGSANNTNPGVLVPGQPIVGGSISLQAETAEIDFRKVEVLNLEGCMDPKSSSYRPYFIKHDPAACK